MADTTTTPFNIWAGPLDYITGKINDATATLQPYTITLGDAQGGFNDAHSIDGGAIHRVLFYTAQLDKFIPVHDAGIPILTTSVGIAVAMLTIRVIKFFTDMIP